MLTPFQMGKLLKVTELDRDRGRKVPTSSGSRALVFLTVPHYLLRTAFTLMKVPKCKECSEERGSEPVLQG